MSDAKHEDRHNTLMLEGAELKTRSQTDDLKRYKWAWGLKSSKLLTLVVHRNNKILSCISLTPSPLSWVFCLRAPYSIKSTSTCGRMEKQLQAWAFLTQTVRHCSPCCLCATLGPSSPAGTGHPVTTPTLSQTRQEWDSGEIKGQTSPKAIFFSKICYMLKGCKKNSSIMCAVGLSTTEDSPNLKIQFSVSPKGRVTGILGKSHS